MPTTNFGQTLAQRDTLRRELLEFAKGTSQGLSSARFFTKQELVDHGTIQLDYPEELVRSVIREMEVQRVLRFSKVVTS